MKFVAEKPDLTLELTTLSGEEIVLEPAQIVNAQEAIKIMDKWRELENRRKKNIEKEKNSMSGIELFATELSFIYPKSKDWFLDNLDCTILHEILMYVAEIIGGIKKNITESKESQD